MKKLGNLLFTTINEEFLMRRILSIFTLLLFLFSPINAQDLTTEGTDFWVSFQRNDDTWYNEQFQVSKLVIIISSQTKNEVTVTNQSTGYSENFTVVANQTLEIPFEGVTEYSKYAQENRNVVENLGFHITSKSPVSVYTLNTQFRTADATMCLPTEALGSYYVVQTYASRRASNSYIFKPSFFQILAVEDGTEVEIKASLNDENGHEKGVPYSVKLNAGDVYMAYSTVEDVGEDFSGTEIRVADGKKIALFQGVVCARVPYYATSDADMLLEQAYPAKYWGKEFILVNAKKRVYSFYRITAEADGADFVVVSKEDTLMLNIGPYETLELEMKDKKEMTSYLIASAPVCVYQYLPSNKYDGYLNDYSGPSMMWVAPLEQRVNKITFPAFEDASVNENFINVVVKAEDEHLVTLDGVADFATFEYVDCKPDYMFARVDISSHSHVIESPNGAIVNVYGQGDSESYAYTAGSSTRVINPDDVFVTLFDTICANETYSFGGETLSKSGSYIDTLELAEYDSIVTLQLTVRPQPMSSFVEVIPAGESYHFDGKDLTEPGTYERVEKDIHGCDSMIILDLVVEYPCDTVKVTIEDVVCDGAVYQFGGQTLYESGVYKKTDIARNGCDSITTLVLTVLPRLGSVINEVLEVGGSYMFGDKTLTEPGRYSMVLPSQNGCDSIVVLNLKATPVRDTVKDTICDGETLHLGGSDYKASGVYTYTLYSNLERDTIITLELAVLPKSESEISDAIYQNESYTDNGFSIDVQEVPGNYKFTQAFTNVYGCDSIVTLNLTVRKAIDLTKIPTVFTPYSENGINDVFMPDHQVYIYDRYGNLVCASDNGWDGKYKGKLADPGTYVYVVMMADGDKKRGTIEVLKLK